MMREAIIRKMVEREAANHSMLEQDVQRDDELLHIAATNEFGSWETALAYAGVNVRHGGQRGDLTVDQVKQQLRRLCTTGYDLGAQLNRSRQRALYDAALRYFGTWRGALKASGINLANVTARKPKHLDRETMLLWIRNRHASHQTLSYSEVCLENRAHALAIRREFGSWMKAIEEALPSTEASQE
jgi:hypothetical protein